jgi:hypothetical protein
MSEPYNACYAPPSGARAQRGRAPQRSEERRSSERVFWIFIIGRSEKLSITTIKRDKYSFYSMNWSKKRDFI